VSLFGPLHLSLLLVIAIAAAGLSLLMRRGILPQRGTCRVLGLALAANEVVWWVWRYSREGIHAGNLPLQLCDAAVWFAVAACLTGVSAVIEFGYFAGLAGAAMALLTPNLIAPWPAYPALYFFAAHGGIVICVAAAVFGADRRFGARAVWRSFALLLSYAAMVGIVDAVTGSDYMFLLRKPGAGSLLDYLGPWPWYVATGAAVALALFWILWWPVRLTPAAMRTERPLRGRR
jgi:hypothetical integral membrane protein (TIGR02206 family)